MMEEKCRGMPPYACAMAFKQYSLSSCTEFCSTETFLGPAKTTILVLRGVKQNVTLTWYIQYKRC